MKYPTSGVVLALLSLLLVGGPGLTATGPPRLATPNASPPVILPDGRTLTTIDFDRHVQPLLNKHGCNAGACHGAAQSKGSFSLSLFSGSPAMDHEEITRGSRVRRLNFAQPEASLLLLKAGGRLDHKGGIRLRPGSWEYRLLLRWIGEGAPRRSEGGEIVRLEVTPAEHFFIDTSKPIQLRVVAEFSDGTREDVTPFTDFRTPESEVVKVTPDGQVQALTPGFAPVLAFYRNRLAPTRILVPWPASSKVVFPVVPPVNSIDREVFGLLKKLNLPPANRIDDTEFLRRVCIDVAGRLPTPDEARAFLTNTDLDKREKKIDELLHSPLHAGLWARRFSQIIRMQPNDLRLLDAGDFRETRWAQMGHEWFRARVRDNVPVDRIFRGLLLATSREQITPASWIAKVRQLETVDPFHSAYPERATLDLFWQVQDPGAFLESVADKVAGVFLGVPLECATCHHHPLAPWSSADRRAFHNVFAQVRIGTSPESSEPVRAERAARLQNVQAALDRLATNSESERQRILQMPRSHVRDLALLELPGKLNARKDQVRRELQSTLGKRTLEEVFLTPGAPAFQFNHPDTKKPAPARILGGPPVTFESDARDEFFRWLTTGDQPPLARVFVNRVWKIYFGTGLVEPVDVVVEGNPPTIPALLDTLTQSFVVSGYDLRKLERMILLSHTYQLSSIPVPGYEKDRWFPARGRPFRLQAPLQLDLLADALGGHDVFPELPRGLRFTDVTANPAGVEAPWASSDDRERSEAMDRLFCRQELLSRCWTERGGWLSSLYTGSTQFDTLFRKSQRARDFQAIRVPPEELLAELFLASLTRHPKPEEKRAALDHIAKAEREPGKVQEAWVEVLWALTNTKEFAFRR